MSSPRSPGAPQWYCQGSACPLLVTILASFFDFVFSLIFDVALGGPWGAFWHPWGSKSMRLLKENNYFHKVAFSDFCPFWAPLCSPRGSLGEPFWFQNARGTLGICTFGTLKTIKKCYKVMQKSTLVFFVFSFFLFF